MSQVTAAAAEPAVLVDLSDIESSSVARVAVMKNSIQRTLVFNSDHSLRIGDAAVDVLAVHTAAGTNKVRSHSEDPLQAAKVAHQLKLQAQAAEYRKNYLLHPQHVEISKYKDTGQVSTLTGGAVAQALRSQDPQHFSEKYGLELCGFKFVETKQTKTKIGKPMKFVDKVCIIYA